MTMFPSTASCAPHQQQHHRIPSSPERLERERRVALEFLSGFKNEQNLNLQDLSKDEIRLLGRAKYENSGLLQGLAAGALTLVTLRRGPIYMARYLQKYHSHQWSSPKLSKQSKAPTTTNSPFHPNNNHNPVVVPPNESPLMKAGWWLIDLTLSFAGAVMAATATTNQEELLMTLSQIPRVPDSRISDSYCPQAMLMLRGMKSRKRSDDDSITALLEESPPQSVMLQAMLDFTRACEQRENSKVFLAQGIMKDVNDEDDSLFETTDNGISSTSSWDDTTRR
jgi:hypothetical protein